MIEQCLTSKNKSATVLKSKNFCKLNKAKHIIKHLHDISTDACGGSTSASTCMTSGSPLDSHCFCFV